MDYQPIENYGTVGDLNTVALVGLNGSIDFLCFPDFDSPSIFAAMLDKEKGGSFSITSASDDIRHKQLYLPDTNVLVTRFLAPCGVAELTDFMPVQETHRGNELIRRVSCIQGAFSFVLRCAPRFDYARTTHKAEQVGDKELVFTSEGASPLSLRLRSNIPLQVRDGDGYAEFVLRGGQTADFILEDVHCTSPSSADVEEFVTASLYDTIRYWKKWMDQSVYRGKWMEIVNRSALALKLMISHRYGSMVAAPTFSLPEEIGGIRNWDYRYTWIRDASFTVYALLKLGYQKEATAFIKWVEKQCDGLKAAATLNLMYMLNGETELTEIELEYLEGYKGSKPVRIGNGAYTQVQLDIYGELLDAVYLYDKNVELIAYHFWQDLSKHVDWLCENWNRPDEGIWEVRGGKREFLYSRLMCWVAMDRGIKIAQNHSYPINPRWIEERNRIFRSIYHNFWDEDLKAFVQYKGAKTVDAATLLMPIVRFIGPRDPQWLSTLKRIEKELVADFLVYRYRPDAKVEGLSGGEGTFSMCTFWYIECLSLAGETDRATLYFEKMLGFANHLGLYAEMLSMQGGHLGNFPQAFTHLGLITAALHLNKQNEKVKNNKL